MVINILDSNDQQPEFSENSYNITIPENVGIGTIVLTVEAKDKDVDGNAVFRYHILGGDDKFEISNDGVIVTKAMLDYETKTSYTFLVSSFKISFTERYPTADCSEAALHFNCKTTSFLIPDHRYNAS